MTLQTDTRISHAVFGPRRMTRLARSLIDCPHCGEVLLAPTRSEYRGQGRIRHYWTCDGCGEETQSLVRVSAH